MVNVHPHLVDIACAGYYDNGDYVKWSSLQDPYMIGRMKDAMEAMLSRTLPLIEAGEPVTSRKVIIEGLRGAFHIWTTQEDGWDRWVYHYGEDQYNIYAPAIEKALTSVFD